MTRNAKKENPPVEFKLNFTGKCSILMELEDVGPMQIRVDDKEFVTKLMKLLVKEIGPTTDVNAYDKRTEKTYKKMLEF